MNHPYQVGRYVVVKEVGRGSMSVVYEARDPLFERYVALKFLLPAPHQMEQLRERFLREARIIAALDHPAIVPVYDLAEYEAYPYLVMRYMPQGSLAERIGVEGMTLAEVAGIMGQLAPGLDEAHRQGVIHRDLKPSNILFDQRQMPFLSDFGIAKLVGKRRRLTNTGYLVGTPAYMSPEQIEGCGDLDGRSDIYSLGILCYELLTGELPFDTTTPLNLVLQHMNSPLPDVVQRRPTLPAGCQQILARATAKNRADRFPTAVSFATALQALVADAQTLRPEPLRTLLVQPSPHNPAEKLALVVLKGDDQADLLTPVVKETAVSPPQPDPVWQTYLQKQRKPALLPLPAATRPTGRRRMLSFLLACLLTTLLMLGNGHALSSPGLGTSEVEVGKTAVYTPTHSPKQLYLEPTPSLDSHSRPRQEWPQPCGGSC